MTDDSRSEPMMLPTFDEAVSQLRRMPPSTWLNLARDDQSRRWRVGCGVPAEDYLAALPEMQHNIEDVLILICGEVQLRTECAGATPKLTEYQQRFPGFADDLALQFEVNRLFDDEFSAGFTLGISPPDDPGHLKGYELEAEIGRGASSVVYRARQLLPNRLVAIKKLQSNNLDTGQRTRQLREARILAAIQHPNVIRIYEAVEYADRLHLVMELIDGPTLDEHISGRPLPAQNAAEMMLLLSEAMEVVHAAGILHRDLKPSNVLLTSGNVPIITDFGLAKWLSEENGVTTENSLLGTPSYMAPEQAVGGSTSAAPTVDVYSLGAIFYELLTGRPPFVGATLLEILTMIREREAIPPRKLVPSIPRDLQTICLKCLHKAPQHRYASCKELAYDLRRFVAGESICARPPLPHEAAVRWIARNPVRAVTVAAVFALLSVVAVGWHAVHLQRLQQSRESLVEAIANADVRALPMLLTRLDVEPDATGLPWETIHAHSKRHSPSWLNINLAKGKLGMTGSREVLLEYLPSAASDELPLIIEILGAKPQDIPEYVWQQLQDPNLDNEKRLRLACGVASQTEDLDRWHSFSLPVSTALIQQHPLHLGAFMTALRPAREALVPSLLVLARDTSLDVNARGKATELLADFAVDHADDLAELIADVEADSFRLLLPALRQHRDEAIRALTEVAVESVSFEEFVTSRPEFSPSQVERAFDAIQQRRAKALVAIWHLGEEDRLLACLQYGAEASLRSMLIELLGPLGATADGLSQRLGNLKVAGVQQALVLAIGQTDLDKLSDQERESLVDRLEELSQHTFDAGVHSACEWLLHAKLGRQLTAAKPRSSAAIESFGWWVGPNNHTFVNLKEPGSSLIGSPAHELLREEDEETQEAVIDRDFAVSSTEVTVAQFLRFRSKEINRRYSPCDDCPVNNVTFFEAVAYCRWLSEQGQVPEVEMCYPPPDQIDPGMQLPTDWDSRTGYRLLTEVEWEYACRAGVPDSRFFGEGQRLQAAYAWTVHNSEDQAWPVATLKPNAYGLFDILGNIGEICHPSRGVSNMLSIDRSQEIPRRGGDFGDTRGNVRAARRHTMPATSEWGNTGFRVARTLRRPPPMPR